MINELVREVANRTKRFVRTVFITVDGRAGFNMIANFALKCGRIMLRYGLCSYARFAFPVTFKKSKDCDLASTASHRAMSEFLNALLAVHVPCEATDVGFLYFNFARHLFKRTILKCKTDTMHHVPSGFLRDGQGAMDFIRTNPVFRGSEQPDSNDPLVQRN